MINRFEPKSEVKHGFMAMMAKRPKPTEPKLLSEVQSHS